MITDADVTKLKEVFATKDELAMVAVDVTELKVESSLLQQTVQRLEQGMERMEGKVDNVLNKLDKFTGNIADLDQENRMGAITLRRHDIQIHELAEATSTTISE